MVSSRCRPTRVRVSSAVSAVVVVEMSIVFMKSPKMTTRVVKTTSVAWSARTSNGTKPVMSEVPHRKACAYCVATGSASTSSEGPQPSSASGCPREGIRSEASHHRHPTQWHE
eukprot:2221764-Prymnesium_polylepis.3